MRGDILLYRSGGSPTDRLISWATHGPYVHVEVDLGNGQVIGALDSGIHQYYPGSRPNAVITLQTDSAHIEQGIVFLDEQIGSRYGWADILDEALKTLHLHFLYFVIPHTYDCSDLVARYIDRAGGLDLGSLRDTPQVVSPNDIARAAKLL